MTSGEHDGVRYRRAQSVTRAEEIQAVEQKVRKSQPDKPIHKPRDSLLSWNSNFENFTGFVNWAFLLLSIGGLRLLLENFIKYGVRVDPIQWIYALMGQNNSGPDYPSLVLFAYHVIPLTCCLFTEKALAAEILPNGPGMVIHIVNLLVLILLPMLVMYVKDGFNLICALSLANFYSILFLKLWSFVQVNMWCRSARQATNGIRRQSLSYSNLSKALDDGGSQHASTDDLNNKSAHLVQYPDNLTLKQLYYFIMAPTLCYELNFPRVERIRKRFLIRRIFEFVAGLQIILCIFQQYMIPCVKNSLIPFSNMDITLATERILKLAIPNHLIWLIAFYIWFHSYMNIIAEIIHFGDRNFYNDWWNANNIETFWRNWNLPAHRFAVRHVYVPLMEMGYSRAVGSTTVFVISAFFHEYMVSIPLKTYKIWAFMGMMAQIPLSHFSKVVEQKYGPRFGNIIVWGSLIIGQPLCIMMYYHDYVVSHFGQSLLEDYGHV